MLDAWAANQQHKRGGTPDEAELLDDPYLKGAESPALERYRLARARMAERQLEELQGQIITRAKLRPALSQLAMILRRAGENIERAHGRPAADILDEALTEAEQAIEQMVADDEARESLKKHGDDDHHNPKDRQPADAGASADVPRRKSAKAAKHAPVRRKRNRPA